MNLVEAGLDILFYLMNVDNIVSPSEMQEIIKYLLKARREILHGNNVYTEGADIENVSMEIGLLYNLSREDLKKRYHKAVEYFNTHALQEQKEKLIYFALKLIEADGNITKDFRPRYAKFAMQLLRLGSGEKTLHTFFLNDEKERTQCSLSFDRPKESEPKACPEAKPKGKPVGVALSANSFSIPIVLTLIL